MTLPLRPPLKWAGGKRWLIPRLQQYWEQSAQSRLVEPFCGGLSVALGLQVEQALLNDINTAVINFYQQIQQGLVIDKIELINDETVYYRQRAEFNHLNQRNHPQDRNKAAQLFYYLNRTGYNGLCRFNQSGGYNVPFGRYKSIHYQTDFSVYREQLAKWEFSSQDFADLVVNHNDFIYADPPYDVPFQQYAQQGFNWDDQQRLVAWLDQHPGPVLLSNQATERIVHLYQQFGYTLIYLDAPRRISCKGNQRQDVKEVLAVRGF